ncbi:FAD-binding protein [Paenarthrobacter sp. DKR-5]|uniref:FAD-binding oxidoreductase n=1 Tax=Paenarthrobacter sp. DKR-5 TaxID=2835535 RepID=UPI001BDDAACD|nr:FAD-linked oxidase C-terminal domain-containing protein [Paenarthrobacter sp. DKR-5]MBT1002337.1 FAD-binding protein [Paenarthrobacter sp. DKR-5]
MPATDAEPAADVLDALVAALPGRVFTDEESLERCRRDRSGHVADGTPLAEVRARSVADVQAACRIASASGTPLITRGAGTGLACGGLAGSGAIVLSTMEMDAVLEVSAANQTAVVEPGILNGDLNRILTGYGLWWAPDPASKDISTVGGNIATNAGGLLCAKYGVTREAVLALKVVLADGRLLSVGHRSVKGVTGYDLCALMVGSEGTLGVIVECTLRLRPLPASPVATIGAFFPSVDVAAAAASRVTASGVQPAVMELMDRATLECVSRHTGVDLVSKGNSYLLIQCDGAAALTEAEALLAVVGATATAAELTTDPEESERLLAVRRQAFPSLEPLGTILVEDIAVPRDQLAAAFGKIGELEQRYGMLIPTVCHAGDGNLHPNFVFQGDTVPEVIWEAAGELFSFAISVGGTLSGEHGIGVLKQRWLAEELGDLQWGLQRQIKALFDPAGILNPGTMFDR